MITRIQSFWSGLAGVPTSFGATSDVVVVSPGSALCPPGWVGIVLLKNPPAEPHRAPDAPAPADPAAAAPGPAAAAPDLAADVPAASGYSAVVTAPSDFAAGMVRAALDGLPISDWATPAALRSRLPIDEILGPATLAYCSTLKPALTHIVERGDVADLVAQVSPEEAGEADLPSPAFVIRSGGQVVAAAGYDRWPNDVAHLSVLTAPAFRGRGLAKAVASAAVADALKAGLLPQWRARPEASRRVARALGFEEFGTQLSVRLA